MGSKDLLKKAVAAFAAFKALSPEQQAEMLEEQRQSWVRGNVGLSRDERGMTSPVMPRPAPAATDTVSKDGTDGLVTVAKQHRLIRGGYQGSWQPYAAPIFADDKYETRELVTRSQAESEIRKVRKDAEELLSAERAKKKELNRLIEVLVKADAAKDAQIAGWTESGKLWTAEIRELQADNAAKDQLISDQAEQLQSASLVIDDLQTDNAALTARIKELEKECDDFCADLNQERKSHESAHNRAEDLKAKLAATEKALEPFALISSEGVIKQEAGHVTVITCAEYFHKARAVLGGKS